MKKIVAAASAALAIGIVSQAAAATATSYDATSHQRSSSDNHSVWLRGFENVVNTAPSNHRFDFAPAGTFVQNGDGTASLSGSVFSQTAAGSGFTVSLILTDIGSITPTVKASHGLMPVIDEYYQVGTGSKLTGFGAYAGLVLNLTQNTGGNNHYSQLGESANDKTANYGFSTWVFYQAASVADGCTSSFCANASQKRQGDFNLDLTPDVDNIVPIPGAAVLMGGVLAGFGAMRRRKK